MTESYEQIGELMEWDQKGNWARFCNDSGYSVDFGFCYECIGDSLKESDRLEFLF